MRSILSGTSHSSCLIAMSCLVPDFISKQCFTVDDAVKLFEQLSFCNDEMM